MREIHLVTTCVDNYQEDTLMALETCKDVDRWYEKAYQAVERIDYINVVQKGRDVEENGIRVLRDSNISQIRKEVEYWVSMAQEPQ